MAKRFFLLEVEGDEGFLRGYVEGYFCAQELDVSGVYFGSDLGLDDERFLTRVQTFLGLKVEHNLLLIREDLKAHLEEAIARLSEQWRLHLKAVREVREVRYPFRVDTPSRKVADRLKVLFEALPEGASVERLTVREEERGEGFEASAYAPDHPYRFRAEGILAGEIEATLKAYRLLVMVDVVVFDEPMVSFA